MKDKANPPSDARPAKAIHIRPATTDIHQTQEVAKVLLGDQDTILATSQGVTANDLRIKIGTIPPCLQAYSDWYTRVAAHKSGVWYTLGIHAAIRTSLYPYHIRPAFLTMLMHFWNTDVNCFCLPRGMIGPNLLDTALIAQLPVIWTDPAVIPTQPKMDIILTHKNWSGFITANRGVGVVTDSEHAAFLLYWLHHYIVWPSNKKPSSRLMNLACWLAKGRRAAVGSLFLAELYRGIGQYVTAVRTQEVTETTITGPMWFLEVWARYYFSLGTVGYLELPKDDRFGVPPAIEVMRATNHTSSLVILTKTVLMDSRLDEEFFIYEGSMHIAKYPVWADPAVPPPYQNLDRTAGDLASWDSFIRPRYLFASPLLNNGKMKIRPEVYMPNCMARQLGCCQAFPRLLPDDFLPSLDDFGFLLPRDATEMAKAMDKLVCMRSQIPFKLQACALETFNDWWESLWNGLCYSYTEIINRLGLMVNDMIEPQPEYGDPFIATRIQPKRKTKKKSTQANKRPCTSSSKDSYQEPSFVVFLLALKNLLLSL